MSPRPLLLLSLLVALSASTAEGAKLPRNSAKATWAARLVDAESGLPSAWDDATERAEARGLLARARAVFGGERAPNIVETIEAELEASTQAASLSRELEGRIADAPTRLEHVTRELEREEILGGLPPEETLPEALRLAEAELKRTRQELERIETARTERASHLVETTAELERLGAEQDALASPSAGAPLRTEEAALELALRLATRLRLREQIEALENEVAKDRAEQDLLPKLFDLETRRVRTAEARLARLRRAQNDYERISAENTLGAARRQRSRSATVAFVQHIAEANIGLAERSAGRQGLVAQLRIVEAARLEAQADVEETRSFFDDIQALVRDVGLTPELGQMLREQRTELPNPFWIRRAVGNRTDQIGEVTVALFEVRNRRKALADPKDRARRLASNSTTRTASVSSKVLAEAEALLERQQDLLEELENRYLGYLESLRGARAYEREYAQLVQAFGAFLDARLVWIRSAGIFGPSDLRRIAAALGEFANPSGWKGWPRRVLAALGRSPFGELWPLLLAIALRFLLRGYAPLTDEERPRSHTTFGQLCLHLAAETGAALISPLEVFTLARWASVHGLTPVTDAVGHALTALALLWFALNLARGLTRPHGLGELDFRWPAASLRLLHHQLGWLRPALLAAWLPFGLIRSEEQELVFASLSRAGFLVAMGLLFLFAFRTLHPDRALMRPIYERQLGGWVHRLRHPLYFASLAIPAALGLLAFSGYFFTAMVMQIRIFQSLALLMGILVGRAVLLEWLRNTRRNLLRKKHAEAMEEAREGAELSSRAILEEAMAEIDDVDAQTRQVFRGLTIVTLVLGTSVIWLSTLTALETLERVEIYPHFLEVLSPGADEAIAPSPEREAAGPPPTVEALRPAENASELPLATRVSLQDVLLALLILALTGAASQNLPGLVEILLLQRLPLDRGTRYAISTVMRYLLSIVGLLAALDAVELGWSKVQWLAAALTFGLGFGLQEIFANFVSGLIILFERPIRVGDVVTVGSTSGRVARVNMRATTIVDWDNKELVVPNKDFITQEVVNWTLSNQVMRVQVEVGVAYGSDVELALATLLEVARATDNVVSQPAPEAHFVAFGASSLDLRLFVHISDVEERHRVPSQLLRAINRAFEESGLVIAFPQLDLHVQSLPAAMPEGRGSTS